jgi:membrane-associated phospholipid phosphatase
MCGRVYFACHWALDTAVGALLGAGVVAATSRGIGLQHVGGGHFAKVGALK